MKLTPAATPATADANYPSDDGVLVQIDAGVGGFATFDVFGTFGAATAKLQHQPPGSSIWRDCTDAEFTSATDSKSLSVNIRLSTRKYRFNVSSADGSTSLEAELNN